MPIKPYEIEVSKFALALTMWRHALEIGALRAELRAKENLS